MTQVEKHVHKWKDAPDWRFGPGLLAQECFLCRSVRVLRVKQETTP